MVRDVGRGERESEFPRSVGHRGVAVWCLGGSAVSGFWSRELRGWYLHSFRSGIFCSFI